LEDSDLLGCDVVLLGMWFPMFRKIMVLSSSGISDILGFYNLEDEGTTIL
jgi:hypothetical protein